MIQTLPIGITGEFSQQKPNEHGFLEYYEKSIVMKQVTVIAVAFALVIAACNNANDKPPVTDSIRPTTPIDTVKIDTVKPTDSIIKG